MIAALLLLAAAPQAAAPNLAPLSGNWTKVFDDDNEVVSINLASIADAEFRSVLVRSDSKQAMIYDTATNSSVSIYVVDCKNRDYGIAGKARYDSAGKVLRPLTDLETVNRFNMYVPRGGTGASAVIARVCGK